MKIGSLFAGIGGLELGLEWAGVGHTVWQVEQNAYAQRVLAKHWPHARRYDDVRTVGAHNLEPVDVLCGGFPCQDISAAGRGAGLSGERSGLWFEYLRLVGELRPRFVVVENVSVLLVRGADVVLGGLAALGYGAVWTTLRAADVGAPHLRERLFCVAYAEGVAEREPADSAIALATRGHARVEPRGVGELSLAYADGLREPQPQGRLADERGRAGDRAAVAMGDAAGLGRASAGPETGDRGVAITHGAGQGVGQADAHGARLEERERIAGDARPQRAPAVRDRARRSAGGVESGVGREPPRLPSGLDGTRWPAGRGEAQYDWEAPRTAHGVANRSARLKALGNAVVPQCAYVVGRMLLAIAAALRTQRAA